jgi:hypothetical protein
MIATIRLDALKACVKYHAAVAKRIELFRGAYDGSLRPTTAEEVADIISEANKCGSTCGIYWDNVRVMARPT